MFTPEKFMWKQPADFTGYHLRIAEATHHQLKIAPNPMSPPLRKKMKRQRRVLEGQQVCQVQDQVEGGAEVGKDGDKGRWGRGKEIPRERKKSL